MTDPQQTLTGPQIHAAELTDWRQLLRGLHTRFATGDFATGLTLAAAIGEAAEEANHHPDLDLRYPHLDVALTSHDVGGVTQRDLDLARVISALAAEHGVAARPQAVSVLELGLDTADAAAIRPFWLALLDLPDTDGTDEIIDSSGRLPTIWFQSTEPHETPRQRLHVDITVPHDVAERRVAAAVAAGGTLESDSRAPSFWVLVDADGNRACVCTWQDRD
ncbi:4a-hydroxytetrahydrobiopterin dehydratase [Nocardioides sp.]|uniref:4a-hydroxytetrahydrobiopterin dehydratase n=1 Tax=Nocardioides sp. TaxID=35761 RepID=UPI003D0E21E1